VCDVRGRCAEMPLPFFIIKQRNQILNKEIMKVQFNHDHALAKDDTRWYLLEQMEDLHKYKPKLLTLPANNFLFEHLVSSRYNGASIDCVEYDKAVYEKAKTHKLNKYNYEYLDVFDKAHANPGKYDLIWIDLCGNLSLSNMNNLISVIQNTLKSHSILAFTFTAGREIGLNKIMEVYGCKEPKEFRFKFFPNLLVRLGKLSHPKFRLDNLIKYKNNKGHSTPMCMFVFKTY
jgi:hypothetical protein